jgi:hypothetical protein
MDVKQERSGWRDEEISARHRLWGWNCPAVDLDFLMCEYNRGEPVALVEYKHETANLSNMSSPTINAIVKLCDGYKDGNIACFIAMYNTEFWWFRIIPLNDYAKAFYKDQLILSEKRFVKSLYALRKIRLVEDDEKWLSELWEYIPETTCNPLPPAL